VFGPSNPSSPSVMERRKEVKMFIEENKVQIEEVLQIAREFMNYSLKMPNDPYARRWRLAGLAMIAYANSMGGEQ